MFVASLPCVYLIYKQDCESNKKNGMKCFISIIFEIQDSSIIERYDGGTYVFFLLKKKKHLKLLINAELILSYHRHHYYYTIIIIFLYIVAKRMNELVCSVFFFEESLFCVCVLNKLKWVVKRMYEKKMLLSKRIRWV
jgi:hypothetical protein